ncbi:MAG: CbiQ family ECF transporter T component, partial [Calditrichota bacterium]
MKSISFRYKALAAVFLLLFSAFYQQLYYNLMLIILLLVILKVEKIKLFRVPGQVWFFSFFLISIFIMQSINSYGTILFELPLGLYVSREGLQSAFLFTSGILLVFLLCATAIYTTPPESFRYYLARLEKKRGAFGQLLYRAGRIFMVVMHLIQTAL